MTAATHDQAIEPGPVPVGKVTAPLARELAVAHAEEVGACIRPLAVRRIDTTTGQTTVVPIPCGATRESVCRPCATRARRLRLHQAREGWHLTEEPTITTAEPTVRQRALLGQRADLEDHRAAALEHGDHSRARDLEAAIDQADALLRAEGIRGSLSPVRDHDEAPRRRTRSTRRRQDAPDLPRHQVRAQTTGRVFEAPNGRTYRPSTFVTLTLPSYGPVRGDGAPRDPERYDYRRAARDALHFGKLVDRFWQNLRRAAGWNVQYFAAVEPQRRGAPHLHAAIRGTLPRTLIREVAAATYHQVWWPPSDQPVYTVEHPPVWDEAREQPCYVDPDTGVPLPTWEQAVDTHTSGADARPAHVLGFGAQVDIQGVLGDTSQADRALGYLTKYLTKGVAECHTPESPAAQHHVDRLAAALRHEPCSETCANWLLYGVTPKNARAGVAPGMCKAKAHKAEHLGYGGRRCLVSRLWSGKTLTEHRGERRSHVLRVLGAVGAKPEHDTDEDNSERYTWQLIGPRDPDQPDRLELLLRSIAQRRRWREQYDQAKHDTGPASSVRGAAA
ncbi:replication initiator [Actinomycetospora sp. OC33-EN08]|uniref:Replication initiator n=1 Tax=Actinomycetospora aurantiaca TaxID=3129233 RepID=A0ABU8MXV3_9PSEU